MATLLQRSKTLLCFASGSSHIERASVTMDEKAQHNYLKNYLSLHGTKYRLNMDELNAELQMDVPMVAPESCGAEKTVLLQNDLCFVTSAEVVVPFGPRLRAKDPLWAICPVPHLSDICRRAIVLYFIQLGVKNVLRTLSEKDRNEVMKLLPTDLPLEFILPVIVDNKFWERCCHARWQMCDVYQYEKDWRKMYVERHVEELIENFVPSKSDILKLENEIGVCKNFITRLNIKQLLLPDKEENTSKEFEDLGCDITWNHMDIGKILLMLPYLEELSITFATKSCGSSFNWDIFKFTNEDCINLSNNLEKMANLKIFRLYESSMNDQQVEQLVSKLLEHPMLRELDFSYNSIGGCGCQALAKLLLSPCPLEALILCHNMIGEDGMVTLAAALSGNVKLKHLDLRLNHIGDGGSIILCKSLSNNTTLKKLDVAGNRLGKDAGLAFADLVETSQSLTYLNLSVNTLGEEVGQRLKEAVEKNSKLVNFDVRLCYLGEDAELAIREMMIEKAKHLPCFV